MGFIKDLVDRVSDENPLDDYKKFNFNDVLNDLYIIDDLRENGHEYQAKRAYDSFVRHDVAFTMGHPDIVNYVEYLTELGVDDSITIDKREKLSDLKAGKRLDDTAELVRAITIKEVVDVNFDRKIGYDELTKILDASHGRDVTLNRREYALFALSSDKNNRFVAQQTEDLVQEYPLPNVAKIKNIHAMDDLPNLFKEYHKDDYFNNRYRIENVYAIGNNEQSAHAPKQGRKEIILNSGTSNVSLVKILSGGFKRPSDLARENNVQMSGQMYGDAVYFARPNQISKNTAYLDRENEGSKFIVVAGIHYDKEVLTGDMGHNFRYNGHTMVHAENVGRYDRDEYMVAPEQIEVKYVLEVNPARHKQPFKQQSFKTASPESLAHEKKRVENLLKGLDANGRTRKMIEKLEAAKNDKEVDAVVEEKSYAAPDAAPKAMAVATDAQSDAQSQSKSAEKESKEGAVKVSNTNLDTKPEPTKTTIDEKHVDDLMKQASALVSDIKNNTNTVDATTTQEPLIDSGFKQEAAQIQHGIAGKQPEEELTLQLDLFDDVEEVKDSGMQQ